MPSLKLPLDDYALPTRERMDRAGENWQTSQHRSGWAMNIM